MKIIKILFFMPIVYLIFGVIMYLKLLIPSLIAFIVTSPILYQVYKRKRRKRLSDNIHKLTKRMDKLSGIDFEEYLEDIFKYKKYNVKTTPKTNDQGADLIINKNNKDIVIQAKRYSKPVGNKAIQEVVSAKNYYNCDKAIVITNNSYTKSARELAKKIGVELWNKRKLKKFIYSNQPLQM